MSANKTLPKTADVERNPPAANEAESGSLAVVAGSALLAWEVEVNMYASCIVFAATKAKAKWTAVKCFWEAYGRDQGWPSLSVARRPQHDNYPGEKGRAYSPSYLRG